MIEHPLQTPSPASAAFVIKCSTSKFIIRTNWAATKHYDFLSSLLGAVGTPLVHSNGRSSTFLRFHKVVSSTGAHSSCLVALSIAPTQTTCPQLAKDVANANISEFNPYDDYSYSLCERRYFVCKGHSAAWYSADVVAVLLPADRQLWLALIK